MQHLFAGQNIQHLLVRILNSPYHSSPKFGISTKTAGVDYFKTVLTCFCSSTNTEILLIRDRARHLTADPCTQCDHCDQGKGRSLDSGFLQHRSERDRVDHWLRCPVLEKKIKCVRGYKMMALFYKLQDYLIFTKSNYKES